MEFPVGKFAGEFAGGDQLSALVEDDEDGTPLRVYDRSGRLMKSGLIKSSTDPTAAFAPPAPRAPS